MLLLMLVLHHLLILVRVSDVLLLEQDAALLGVWILMMRTGNALRSEVLLEHGTVRTLPLLLLLRSRAHLAGVELLRSVPQRVRHSVLSHAPHTVTTHKTCVFLLVLVSMSMSMNMVRFIVAVVVRLMMRHIVVLMMTSHEPIVREENNEDEHVNANHTGEDLRVLPRLRSIGSRFVGLLQSLPTAVTALHQGSNVNTSLHELLNRNVTRGLLFLLLGKGQVGAQIVNHTSQLKRLGCVAHGQIKGLASLTTSRLDNTTQGE
jgi:hypothetical protein